MALVSSGYGLTVSIIDNGGNETSVQYKLRSGDHATAVTDSLAVIAALVAVSDGEISGYTISSNYAENALSFPATDAVQAEVSASMTTFVAGAGNKKANYRIPMPKAAIFTASIGKGANIVDTENADVLAFHALFGVGGKVYVSDGENAGGLYGGVRVTRGKRQG
jgi:hypothetical protein